MLYSLMTIYFISGTGNFYRAATWMTEIAKKRNITYKLYQIPRHYKEADWEKDTKDLLGVILSNACHYSTLAGT
jgi:hypothetical protein